MPILGASRSLRSSTPWRALHASVTFRGWEIHELPDDDELPP
jgi:hypothetical protein